MKITVLIAAICVPCAAIGADLTFDEAVAACKTIYPSTSNASDDGSGTFPSRDRINVALEFKDLRMVCSVGKSSREVEQVRGFRGTLFGKQEIRQMQKERDEREQSRARVAAGDHAEFVRAAKTKISDRFKDPASVQFRNLYLSKKSFPTLCGEVNAKNSYGGYVGFRGFIYSEVSILVDDGKELGEGFLYREMLPTSCGEKFAEVE